MGRRETIDRQEALARSLHFLLGERYDSPLDWQFYFARNRK